jgi:hypothetical protein
VPQHASTLLPSPAISPLRACREHCAGLRTVFFFLLKISTSRTLYDPRIAMPMRAARAGPGRHGQVSLITTAPTPTWRAYRPVRPHMPPHYCAATSPLLRDDDPSRNRRDSSKIMADSQAHVEVGIGFWMTNRVLAGKFTNFTEANGVRNSRWRLQFQVDATDRSKPWRAAQRRWRIRVHGTWRWSMQAARDAGKS